MKSTTRNLIALALALGLVGMAHANSFQGTAWSLSYSGLAQPDTDALHETYRITLGVDTNGYNGTGTYLDQVALKVSNSVFSDSLVSAPGGVANWSLISGGLNNNGCSGSGSGFECANSLTTLNSGKGVAINAGNGVGIDYAWVFDITVNNGSLFTGPDLSSVKARFVKGSGAKVGALVSEPISLTPLSPVPLPAAAWLFGSALFGFMMVSNRRKV